MVIQIKRVYEPSTKEDGARFLVERLWPRGMKKEALHMDAWCKNLAPSHDLRRWFSHDPANPALTEEAVIPPLFSSPPYSLASRDPTFGLRD